MHQHRYFRCKNLMNEAEVEHVGAKDLIQQLQATDSSDPTYDAKVTVLSEYVNPHVEEKKQTFLKVKKAKLDLESLGEEIATFNETKETQLMGAAKPSEARSPSARAVRVPRGTVHRSYRRIEPLPLLFMLFSLLKDHRLFCKGCRTNQVV
jgi:hypothetical protein